MESQKADLEKQKTHRHNEFHSTVDLVDSEIRVKTLENMSQRTLKFFDKNYTARIVTDGYTMTRF